jgi:hypothetical protein
MKRSKQLWINRHIATKNHEAGAYKDILDGVSYHNTYLNERNLFVSSKDVVVIIFADGFPSKYSLETHWLLFIVL